MTPQREFYFWTTLRKDFLKVSAVTPLYLPEWIFQGGVLRGLLIAILMCVDLDTAPFCVWRVSL